VAWQQAIEVWGSRGKPVRVECKWRHGKNK
jgi:hypothetical protein